VAGGGWGASHDVGGAHSGRVPPLHSRALTDPSHAGMRVCDGTLLALNSGMVRSVGANDTRLGQAVTLAVDTLLYSMDTFSVVTLSAWCHAGAFVLCSQAVITVTLALTLSNRKDGK